MIRVLIIEDQRDLADGLRRSLTAEGYDVECAASTVRARDILEQRRFDLMLLDLTLPDGDGLEVLRELRQRESDTAVLILTARDTQRDMLAGFGLGADDYVVKPFRLLELLARVRALLRRTSRSPVTGARYSFGEIVVDTGTTVVTRANVEVPLRPKEYELLVALLKRDEGIANRSELLREVWGYEPLVSSRTVDTHILELRRKLEADPASPRHIVTARARGYRLVR